MTAKSKFLSLSVFIRGLSLNGFIREWFAAFCIILGAIFLFPSTGIAQTPITCGIPVTDSISAPNEKDNYSFTASANDSVIIRANKTTGDANFRPYLELRDSNNNGINGGYDAIVHTFTTGGTYAIIVMDDNNTETGNYILTWNKLNSPCGATAFSCSQAATGSIGMTTATPPWRFYTFTASANDTVSIVANKTSGDAGFLPYLDLYASNGGWMGGWADN